MVQTAVGLYQDWCRPSSSLLHVSWSSQLSFTLWISQQQLLFITYEQPPNNFSRTKTEFLLLAFKQPQYRTRYVRQWFSDTGKEAGRHLGVLEWGRQTRWALQVPPPTHPGDSCQGAELKGRTLRRPGGLTEVKRQDWVQGSQWLEYTEQGAGEETAT